jgi:terminase small subunit / prophage DNA-packing protein
MKITGQEKIAEVFGVAPKTIVEWQEQGFPIAVQGKRGVASVYDSQACIAWYVQRELTKANVESPKDRLDRLRGDEVEINLMKARRELIPETEVAPGIVELFVDLRNEVDQLPDLYTDQIVAVAGDPTAVHHVLKQASQGIKDFCAQYEYRQTIDQKGAEASL